MSSIINLDYQSREPIFRQIVSQVERYVALGILKANTKLPSVRELALKLGVNPNTVSKAYSVLEERNVIVTISTKGTFVADSVDLKDKKILEGISKINLQISELVKFGISREEIINRLK